MLKMLHLPSLAYIITLLILFVFLAILMLLVSTLRVYVVNCSIHLPLVPNNRIAVSHCLCSIINMLKSYSLSSINQFKQRYQTCQTQFQNDYGSVELTDLVVFIQNLSEDQKLVTQISDKVWYIIRTQGVGSCLNISQKI